MTNPYDDTNHWRGRIICLSDEVIPITTRIEWMWSKIVRAQPNFRRDLWPNPDPRIAYEIVVNNIYHFKGFFGAQVLDFGANQGVFTVLCALNGSKVTAYEPHPMVLPLLHEVVRRAKLEDKINVVEAAVAKTTGRCLFEGTSKVWGDKAPWTTYNGRICETFGGPSWDPSVVSKTLEIEKISLGQALGDQEWDCVKMDIEGGEFEAFQGVSDEGLRKIKFLALELHNSVADKAEYDMLIKRFERIFEIGGSKDGSLTYKPEERWVSIYATRR